MKYKTFARLRIVAIIGLIVAPFAWFGCQRSEPKNAPPAAAPVASAPVEQPATATNNAAPAPSGGDTSAFTDVHKALVRLQKEPLSNGKEKGGSLQWVYKDAGIRAEFRSDKDKGFDYWNRVKVDYNGNKKDDERWDISKDGKIKRRVSPNDDGNYTETYTLNGDKWEAR